MPSTGHFRALVALSLVLGAVAAPLDTARADQCTRQGVDVTCDDGRKGIWQGDAILWPDGTKSSLKPHPSVIVGNKASVVLGPGVFVGQGKGMVPMDNPSSPNKLRCAVLDGVAYCH